MLRMETEAKRFRNYVQVPTTTSVRVLTIFNTFLEVALG